MKFKVDDKVKVGVCTGYSRKFSGMEGVVVGILRDRVFPYQLCFDGTGISCGALFCDDDLTILPQLLNITEAFKAMIDGEEVVDEFGYHLKFDPSSARFLVKLCNVWSTMNNFVENQSATFTIFTPKPPKPLFKRGDFVELNNTFKRISTVDYKDGKYSYGLTTAVETYSLDGYFNTVAEENIKVVV